MESRLLSGALDLLVLDVLARQESYGYQISQTVVNQSGGQVEVKEGSLYPALHRLERQGVLKSYWVEAESGGASQSRGRRRKYYRITAEGRSVLESKRDEWMRFSSGVSGILGQRHVVA